MLCLSGEYFSQRLGTWKSWEFTFQCYAIHRGNIYSFICLFVCSSSVKLCANILGSTVFCFDESFPFLLSYFYLNFIGEWHATWKVLGEEFLQALTQSLSTPNIWKINGKLILKHFIILTVKASLNNNCLWKHRFSRLLLPIMEEFFNECSSDKWVCALTKVLI